MRKMRGIGGKKAVNVSGKGREREGRCSAGIYCKNMLVAWLERERSFLCFVCLKL